MLLFLSAVAWTSIIIFNYGTNMKKKTTTTTTEKEI